MNSILKAAVKEAFTAPEPQHKKYFFQKIQPSRISMPSFVQSQIGYISKWVWMLDLGVLATALWGASRMQRELLWLLSALMPLLALTLLTESRRSEVWKMAELEMASPFSLKTVLLARMGILGIANLLLFCTLILISREKIDCPLFQTGIYLLCPYLLTSFLGLWVSRRIRGKEALYGCMGLSILVSFTGLTLHQLLPLLYESSVFPWWLGFSLLLTAGVIRESCRMINQTEELAWN